MQIDIQENNAVAAQLRSKGINFRKANAKIILQADPTICELVGFDEHKSVLQFRETPLSPWRDLTPSDAYNLSTASARAYGVTFSERELTEAFRHKLTNALPNALRALVWDKNARLDNWLPWITNCEDNGHNRKIGKTFFIEAARRALYPGSDISWMLVLYGQQGTKKSSLVRAMSEAVLPGYSNAIGSWELKWSKDWDTSGWIVEILATAASKKQKMKLDTVLFLNEDTFRPPYASNYIRKPRSAVYVQTTHSQDEAEMLASSEKYQVVQVGEIAMDAFMDIAPQLWAEAVFRVETA